MSAAFPLNFKSLSLEIREIIEKYHIIQKTPIAMHITAFEGSEPPPQTDLPTYPTCTPLPGERSDRLDQHTFRPAPPNLPPGVSEDVREEIHFIYHSENRFAIADPRTLSGRFAGFNPISKWSNWLDDQAKNLRDVTMTTREIDITIHGQSRIDECLHTRVGFRPDGSIAFERWTQRSTFCCCDLTATEPDLSHLKDPPTVGQKDGRLLLCYLEQYIQDKIFMFVDDLPESNLALRCYACLRRKLSITEEHNPVEWAIEDELEDGNMEQ